jgi:hypothetical protein
LRRAALPLLAFVLPLGVYLIGLRYVGSGDTEPAERLPIALLHQGRLSFEAFVKPTEPLPYWYRDVKDRVVSNYPILPGLLNVPVFAAADLLGVDLDAHRQTLSMITAATISALSVVFLFLALERFCSTRLRAFGFAMLYAFGTCVWSVTSRGLWQHGPALLFLTISIWLIGKQNLRATAWCAFFLSLAVVTRPTNAVLVAPLAAFVLWSRPRDRVAFLAAGLVPLALESVYAWVYWGSPFSLAQANPIPEAANFGGNPLVGLAGLLVSPSRGLFVFSPVFLVSLLALPGVVRRRREDPVPFCLAVGALALLLVDSKWTMWWGGHTFGYRLLIETLPALTVLLAIAWENDKLRRPSVRAALFVLAAWSIVVNFLGARFQPSGFNPLMENDRQLLWSVRRGEIAMSAEKALSELRIGR